jgi:hypothetical protein
MFILTNSIKNIIRNRRRYLISGIFLFIVLSVFACAVFYNLYFRKAETEMINKYLTQVQFRFRDELQYGGERGFYNGMPKTTIFNPDGTEITYIFNEDGSMDQYNYHSYAGRDYFDRFSAIEYIVDYDLGYMEVVYNGLDDKQPETNTETKDREFYLYGGSMISFDRYFADFCGNAGRLRLTDGRENGAGECIIHRMTAENYGYKIGDTVTFTDKNGNTLVSLVISGFYIYEDLQLYEFLEKDVTYRGIPFGSTPYFRIPAILKNIVFTNFDTAYYAYGDESSEGFAEHHEFDKYIAWYTLDSADNFDEFSTAASEFDYDKNFCFYAAETIYDNFGSQYTHYKGESAKYMTLMSLLSIFILTLTSILMIRERKREIGILYALGWEKRRIVYSLAVEMTVFVGFLAVLSSAGGYIMHKLNEMTYWYYRMLAIPYVLTPLFWFILFCTAIGTVFITTLILGALIFRKNPARLIASN